MSTPELSAEDRIERLEKTVRYLLEARFNDLLNDRDASFAHNLRREDSINEVSKYLGKLPEIDR